MQYSVSFKSKIPALDLTTALSCKLKMDTVRSAKASLNITMRNVTAIQSPKPNQANQSRIGLSRKTGLASRIP